jgi:hypothetical protein
MWFYVKSDWGGRMSKLSRRSEPEGVRGCAERVSAIYGNSTLDYEYSSTGPLSLAERPTDAGYDDVLIPAPDQHHYRAGGPVPDRLAFPYRPGSRDASCHRKQYSSI